MGASIRRCTECHASYPGSERFCPIDGGAIVEVEVGAGGARVGQTIDGRYLVRRLLGRGGMGEVYAADHVGLDKQVAIKFVTADNTNPNALARFRREARVASKIVHEHVVQIFDVGSDQGDYIVMEYLEGKDLKQVLSDGKLPVARAVAIAKQMLAGLAAIHDAGILHRDIKPANVLLAKRGNDADFVKIMDFGISRAAGGEDASTLTGTGNVIGTPEYIAPEVLRSAVVDHRADLYAVGITLHAMLAGKPPFTATAFERLIAMHLSEPPPPIEGIPAWLNAVIAKSLAKQPEDRYADARTFAKALEAPRAQAVIVESEERPHLAKRRVPLWVVAGVAAALVIGGGIGIVVVKTRDEAKAATPGSGSAAAIVDAPTSADESMAFGRRAEAGGKLDLALVAYDDAFRVAPTAELAKKLGDLAVLVDKRTAAAAYYRKYLELAPSSPDRGAITATIAALEGATDAGAPTADAADGSDGSAAAIVVDAAPVIDEGTPHCRCRVQMLPVCEAVGDARCMCIDDQNHIDGLCPTALDGASCPANPQFANFALRGHKQGEACHGYAKAGGIEHHGTYECKLCDTNVATYRGQTGETCEGFGATDGVKQTGILADCR